MARPGGSLSISKRYVAIGIVILVVAVVAGFWTRPTGDGATTFSVAWEESGFDLGTVNRTVVAGPVDLGFPVERDNVTAIRVEANVTAEDHPGRDNVTARLVAPGGNATTDEATLGADGTARLEVALTVGSAPTVESVTAPNATEARRRLAANHTSTVGRGAWNLTITIDHDGPPTDHGLRVGMTGTRYRATVTPPTDG